MCDSMLPKDTMLLLMVALCTITVYGYIPPPSSVCNQDRYIFSACKYGNLSVAVVGKTYQPKDCDKRISNKELEEAPFLYFNSTNATERFTVMMIDLGYQGRATNYLQWMVTNVSINTLPDYRHLPVNDVVAAYQQPLLMVGLPQPHLIQILVFRHKNVLRVPFGELWVTQRPDFMLSKLYSNTSPNLQLCGPVAGIQFWVHDDFPSAPPLPPLLPAPFPPPQQPTHQPWIPPHQPGHPGMYPNQDVPPMKHFTKKSLATNLQPVLHVIFVPMAVVTYLYG